MLRISRDARDIFVGAISGALGLIAFVLLSAVNNDLAATLLGAGLGVTIGLWADVFRLRKIRLRLRHQEQRLDAHLQTSRNEVKQELNTTRSLERLLLEFPQGSAIESSACLGYALMNLHEQQIHGLMPDSLVESHLDNVVTSLLALSIEDDLFRFAKSIHDLDLLFTKMPLTNDEEVDLMTTEFFRMVDETIYPRIRIQSGLAAASAFTVSLSITQIAMRGTVGFSIPGLSGYLTKIGFTRLQSDQIIKLNSSLNEEALKASWDFQHILLGMIKNITILTHDDRLKVLLDDCFNAKNTLSDFFLYARELEESVAVRSSHLGYRR